MQRSAIELCTGKLDTEVASRSDGGRVEKANKAFVCATETRRSLLLHSDGALGLRAQKGCDVQPFDTRPAAWSTPGGEATGQLDCVSLWPPSHADRQGDSPHSRAPPGNHLQNDC